MSDNGVREGKIDELIPDRKNANKGTQAGIRALDRSMRELGMGRSVLTDKKGEIIAGNKTTLRAADIGIEDVIIVPTDGTKLIVVERTDLDLDTDEEARQLAYADNRIAELDLEWDHEQIDFDLADGVDLEWLGFEMEQEPEDDPGAQIDRAEELREKWGVESGQLWRLGEHRLICGDCTDAEVVARVMEGEKATLFETDPPYGVNVGKIRQQMRTIGHGGGIVYDDIENDDLGFDDLKGLLIESFSIALNHCVDNVAIYSWMPPMWTANAFFEAFEELGLLVHRRIEWVKESLVLGRGDYHWKHESCIYGWKKGNRPPFYGERNQTTIWEVSRNSTHLHPTEKPIELFEIPINNHTKQSEILLDVFCGSGTGPIACERLGRKCRAVEISPAYCAVAIQRWADMTGQEPELIE